MAYVRGNRTPFPTHYPVDIFRGPLKFLTVIPPACSIKIAMWNMIDPISLALQRERLAGILPLTAMPRVKDALWGTQSGGVCYEFDFRMDDAGYPLVTGRLDTKVILQCQRCMEAIEWPLQIQTQVIVVADEQDQELCAGNLMEAWTVNNDRVFIEDLIEDEIILGLPLVPVHDSTDCAAKVMLAVEPNWYEQTSHLAAPNPFAVLGKLRRNQ